jgi:hypothetical protein
MHKARAFFFVCLGILALVLAYHFGASTATAQAPGNPIVAFTAYSGAASIVAAAVTANGDIYATTITGLNRFA